MASGFFFVYGFFKSLFSSKNNITTFISFTIFFYFSVLYVFTYLYSAKVPKGW